ncbi:putative stem-specific protein TSJT1 [Dioscorea sansibarensis]
MLAVFEQEIAKPPPEFEIHAGCKVPQSRPEMAELFAREFPGSTFYNFINGNFIALSRDNRDQPTSVHPRYMVVMENMFCVFKGKLDNISELSKYYGLNKHANEARLVVEMYKVLRDRAVLYPVDQVIKDLTGAFAFILFDDTTCTLFFATDEERKIPLFWGVAEDKSMAISDNSEIVLDICGQATTHFPPGCLYMNNNINNNGLMSFANPMHKVKAEVGKDSNGDPFSVFFYVDLSDHSSDHHHL